MRRGLWHSPDKISEDLYPGLVVHDGRVSGSITFGPSRLPIWAVISSALRYNWAYVEENWAPSDFDWDEDRLSEFLYCLMELRGDFARLLLALAHAEKQDLDRSQNNPSLAPWWEDPQLSAPVVEALTEALRALGEDIE